MRWDVKRHAAEQYALRILGCGRCRLGDFYQQAMDYLREELPCSGPMRKRSSCGDLLHALPDCVAVVKPEAGFFVVVTIIPREWAHKKQRRRRR